MLKPVLFEAPCLLATPDRPVDNRARPLALFLYETLCAIKIYK
jgi:hypothetical protein